ncbi:XAC2610-related protein [Formosa haliotis]|uniref:XAC2610-related protein n=1 Tax=Formosa haliotis TaxID=1555194 RepID=UPI000825FF54|nr:hypothetical protein [Formosa haliotis]
MKILIVTLIIFSVATTGLAQQFSSGDWVDFENESRRTLKVTQSEVFKYNDFQFHVTWNDTLSYSGNIGYYGGISELKVFKQDKLLQTAQDIEDGIGLGEIVIELYDYNMDGFLDFSVVRECGASCYYAYYLFDTTLQKFVHQESWDDIRIQKLNKIEKLIAVYPDRFEGHTTNTLYKVKGSTLIRVK